MESKQKEKKTQKVPKFGQKLSSYDPLIADEKSKEYNDKLVEFYNQNQEAKDASLSKVDKNSKFIYDNSKNKFQSTTKQIIDDFEALDLLTRGKCKLAASNCLSDNQDEIINIHDEIDALHLLKSKKLIPKYLVNSSLKRQSHFLKVGSSGECSIFKGSKKEKNQCVASLKIVNISHTQLSDSCTQLCIDDKISISELSKINGVAYIIDDTTFVPLKIQTLDNFE